MTREFFQYIDRENKINISNSVLEVERNSMYYYLKKYILRRWDNSNLLLVNCSQSYPIFLFWAIPHKRGRVGLSKMPSTATKILYYHQCESELFWPPNWRPPGYGDSLSLQLASGHHPPHLWRCSGNSQSMWFDRQRFIFSAEEL